MQFQPSIPGVGTASLHPGNASSAFAWYLAAAQRGSATGQFLVGLAYSNGEARHCGRFLFEILACKYVCSIWMSLDWRIRSCGNSISTHWNSKLWSMVKHGVPCWGIGPRWTTFFSEMHGIVWVCMGLRMALPRTFPRLASGWASWQKLHVWGMIRWLRISKHFLIPLTMPSFEILRGIWGNLPVYSCLENSGHVEHFLNNTYGRFLLWWKCGYPCWRSQGLAASQGSSNFAKASKAMWPG